MWTFEKLTPSTMQVALCREMLASFPGFPQLQFLITCSMQKWSEKGLVNPHDPRHRRHIACTTSYDDISMLCGRARLASGALFLGKPEGALKMLKMLMNDAARAAWLEKVSEELHQRWPSVFQELLSRYLSVQSYLSV